MSVFRALVCVGFVAFLFQPTYLSADTLLQSRNIVSESGSLQLTINAIEKDSSKSLLLDSIYSQRHIQAHLEFTDPMGTRIRVESIFAEDMFTAAYYLPTGSFSLSSTLNGKLTRLKVLSRGESKPLFDGSISSFCDQKSLNARQALDVLATPAVESGFDSLRKTINNQGLVPTDLKEFYEPETSRDLGGWACGLLLAATDLSGFGAALVCAGCSPAAGGTGCLPCLGWIVGTLGMGGGAFSACADYFGGSGGDSGGGGDANQPQCWELDDGSIWCVDPAGHVVEISP